MLNSTRDKTQGVYHCGERGRGARYMTPEQSYTIGKARVVRAEKWDVKQKK